MEKQGKDGGRGRRNECYEEGIRRGRGFVGLLVVMERPEEKVDGWREGGRKERGEAGGA